MKMKILSLFVVSLAGIAAGLCVQGHAILAVEILLGTTCALLGGVVSMYGHNVAQYAELRRVYGRMYRRCNELTAAYKSIQATHYPDTAYPYGDAWEAEKKYAPPYIQNVIDLTEKDHAHYCR